MTDASPQTAACVHVVPAARNVLVWACHQLLFSAMAEDAVQQCMVDWLCFRDLQLVASFVAALCASQKQQ
jgi:hypothetical protein